MLCVCIDAFKPDYLKHTKYLKSLSKKCIHGELESVLGYTGITATFLTGVYPDKHGIVSMFKYSNNSSFRWIKNFSFIGKSALNVMINGGRYLKGQKFFFRLPRIPVDRMANFDTSIDRAFPQEGSLKTRSLYDILRNHRKTFSVVDWPNNISHNGSSFFMSHRAKDIQNITAQNLKRNPDFCFTHFFELDYCAHEYGTRSNELKNEVKKLDEIIESFDRDDMFIFSDHGMIDVKGEVDVLSALHDSGFLFGKDFFFFLDSTMARFWFRNKNVKEKIKSSFNHIKGGHILSETEISKTFHLPRNHCDMIFLADEGMVINDNFFQGNEKIKAMHGYDPRKSEQKGFYLVKSSGGMKNAKMIDMLPTMLDYMKLPKISCDGRSLLR